MSEVIINIKQMNEDKNNMIMKIFFYHKLFLDIIVQNAKNLESLCKNLLMRVSDLQ